jgi:flagellar biosynthetic protein FlhB
MADENSSSQERTEQPTARRRQVAHDEGQVPRSQELSSAAVLLGGAAVLAMAGGASLARFAADQLRVSAQACSAVPFTTQGALGLLHASAVGLLLALVPFAAGVMGIVLFVNLLQARGVLSWKPVAPRLSHLNPMAGLKRMMSPEALFNLLKALVKLAALGCITWLVLSGAWPGVLALADTGAPGVMAVLRELLLRLAIVTGFAFLLLSGADYLFQRLRFEKGLRMTRDEVVREYRDLEGNPLVKARMLSIARALARKRMLQHVPTADVVIVNPTRIAVALKYDPLVAPAPIVLAMGQRKLAERIRKLAERANVPIIENRPVARALLATAVVGKPIPPALYIAIAEILAFVYRKRAARTAGPEQLAGSTP